MTNDIIPPEYSWNEAILEKNHPLNTGLITLIAYSPDRSPRIIGTAFTISVFGDSAVGITAAHNFDEIEKSQHPRKGHHRSALPEFLPDSQPDLNPKNLRALCVDGDKAEVATIEDVIFDATSDIAVFLMRRQTTKVSESPSFFESRYQLDVSKKLPKVGSVVSVLGYANMGIVEPNVFQNGNEDCLFQRQLVLRTGRVTRIHKDGHILCKGPCI